MPGRSKFRRCDMISTIRRAIRFLPVTAGWIILATAARHMTSNAFSQQPADRVRTEIPLRENKVILESDFQERVRKSRYRASGKVRITYQDILITCDEAEYDEATHQGTASGNLHFSQGKQWFTSSRADFDLALQTGRFVDATGVTDQEFLLKGKIVVKTGPDTYRVEEGFVTACREPNPKWAFTISRAEVRVDTTARLRRTLFKVKGVPVLYMPYLILPMESKKRSSGLVPPHYGNSTSKGRVFSLGYYQTLGRSADLTLHGDYFTLRGLAMGGIFRARPNPQTKLYVQAYGINDRLGQGGANLVVDAESALGRGIRAVASANITTNFKFRQAFSDSFQLATVPEERTIFFVTQNEDSLSTNIAVQRDEVLFPGRSLVIRKSPAIEFVSLGAPIGRTPLILELRAAAEGLSRTDAVIESPKLVQRLDLYPRLSLRLPALAGFSLIPSAAVRETYYSARMAPTDSPQVEPRSIHRQYFDFSVNVRMPTLERSFTGTRLGSFKHVVEPFAVYRRIEGIDNMREFVRFDEEDAIANTSEFEFGVVNRILSRPGPDGTSRSRELISAALIQKYYLDPSFGGALLPGQPNMFYPLYTVTGFALTGSERRLPPTNLIVRLSPLPAISYDIRADYDTRHQRLRDASISANWQQENLVASGTYIKINRLEPGTFESHHVQGLIGYGSVSRGMSASAALSYDIRTSNVLTTNARLNYVWDCCGVSLQYQQFDLGLRTESRITFSFSLKGIGSFGNIKRPESLY